MKPTFSFSAAAGPVFPVSPPDEQDTSTRLVRAIARIDFPRIFPTSVGFARPRDEVADRGGFTTAPVRASAVSANDQRHDLFFVLRAGSQFPDRTAAA